MYYNMQGKEITRAEWTALFADPARLMLYTKFAEISFSTVWLGMDHSFVVGGPPLIFETMAFPALDFPNEEWESHCERYSTRQQAIIGHRSMIRKWLESHGREEDYSSAIESTRNILKDLEVIVDG